MFFDSWSDLLRVLVVAPVAYAALVAFLRVSGNRTLAKLNAFDLVVTIALGSTLSAVILDNDVALAEGVGALGLLVLLQALITAASTRSGLVRRMIRNEPQLLLRDGRVLHDALKSARLTENELAQALRAQGVGHFEEAAAVILETDGTISALTKENMPEEGRAPTMQNIQRNRPEQQA